MRCIVQKFGGTSVATLERIRNVADIIAKQKANGDNIAVVVSAMAGVTNKFVEYVQNLDASEGDPEYDQVVSSGELVTAGLLAIALKNKGLKSRSYSSWQVPIRTNGRYGQAIIENVDPKNLKIDLQQDIIPVVCGFQGISNENRVTTLGRGGSDLTAVAVASALNADLCEIYSDVDGVYTVDPNIYPNAKRLEQINYREMLKIASQGAKVLQEQSVNYAMQKKVIVRVASSFVEGSGTIISGEISSKQFCGLAVTHNLSHIRITYENYENFLKILELLKQNSVSYEIYKNNHQNKFTILVDRRKDFFILNLLKNSNFISGIKTEIPRKHLSKISVIGSLGLSLKIYDEMIAELIKNKIDVIISFLGDGQIDLIIASTQLMDAISFLHKYCGLDK